MKTPTPMLCRGAAARGFLAALLPLLAALPCAGGAADADPYAAEREALLQEIQRQVRQTSDALGTDRLDPRVLEALRSVPRHAFVPPPLRSEAYGNHPLPIGGGQTISQPFIVAIMSHLLDVEPGEKVYELGTGSGYQAAVLAAMGVEVYSIEIVPRLAERARQTLERLGYEEVHVRAGDGYKGWPEAAPFDGIIVTAAPDHIPHPLVEQLAAGGRMVIPVGERGWVQHLKVLIKTAEGELETRDVLPVRFVPVTGDQNR